MRTRVIPSLSPFGYTGCGKETSSSFVTESDYVENGIYDGQKSKFPLNIKTGL